MTGPHSNPARARPRRWRFRGLEKRARRVLRLWRLYLLRLEIRLAPSETQRLFLLTICIGAACGLAAVAFHVTIRVLETRLIDRAMHAVGRSWIAWTIATPLLGALFCG